MKGRIPANSASFQRDFGSVYANFMVSHELVVGVHCGVTFSAAIGHRSKYVRTMAKLPIKFYAGIRTTGVPGMAKMGTVETYSSSKGSFEAYPYEQAVPEREKIEKEVADFLTRAKFGRGVEISILGESARGHGMGFSGISSAAISAALHLLAGKIDEKDLSCGVGETPKMESVSLFAWKLDHIARYGNSAGDNLNLALAHNGLSLHWCEEFDDSSPHEALSEIKTVSIYPKKSGNPGRITDLPVDACVVFSGLATKTKSVEGGKGADARTMDVRLSDGSGLQAWPKGMAEVFDPKKAILAVEKALSVVDAQIAANVTRLVDDCFDHVSARGLVENMEQGRHAMGMVERSSPFAQELQKAIHRQGLSSGDVGIMPTYTRKSGGACLVLSESGTARKAIENALSELKERYPEAALEYASWLDGDAISPATIEHWPEKNIRSSCVPKGSVTFRDNKGKHYVGNYLEILEREKECLVLDLVEMKVIAYGEKPSSKDIPSQSAAAEALSRVIADPRHEIRNSDLPASSYSKDRGLLVAKALAPLVEFVEKKTGRRLPIGCHGSSGDYVIALGETDLRIGAVSK